MNASLTVNFSFGTPIVICLYGMPGHDLVADSATGAAFFVHARQIMFTVKFFDLTAGAQINLAVWHGDKRSKRTMFAC